MAAQRNVNDTSNVDVTTLNTSCRILVVSPSPTQATALIRRIQTLGSSTSRQATEILSEKKDVLSPELVNIPWTIQNKYYSADIHFAVRPIRGLAPNLLQNIPAVIFVWRSGEAYKHHLERISRDLGDHEPEISLAVRVKPPSDEILSEPIDADENEEDNASIDGFVSSFGFEYVDATVDVADRREERRYEENDEFDGIPGLPRVVDAISTIMWPSMKTREENLKHGKAHLRREPSLFEWGADDRTDRTPPLKIDDLMANSSSKFSASARRRESEIDKLTKWLEDDVRDGDREDPWRMAASSDTIVASPDEDDEAYLDRFSTVASQLEQRNLARFDDDFTVLVSAPATEKSGRGSGYSTPAGDESEGQDGLKPPGGLRSYNSLGSVSDFGESDGGREIARVISDDEDEALPSRDEVLETSSRIFGKRGEASSTKDSHGLQDLTFNEKAGDGETQLDDAYDMAPFDLNKVLGALQQMKEEISVIENEGERRKAAARVALGLVYGLEVEGDL